MSSFQSFVTSLTFESMSELLKDSEYTLKLKKKINIYYKEFPFQYVSVNYEGKDFNISFLDIDKIKQDFITNCKKQFKQVNNKLEESVKLISKSFKNLFDDLNIVDINLQLRFHKESGDIFGWYIIEPNLNKFISNFLLYYKVPLEKRKHLKT